MVEKKTAGVEEKIDQVQSTVKGAAEDAIARANTALDQAKATLGEGYGKVKTRSVEAYEKAKVYLADAREALDDAREKAGELYGRSREAVEEAYDQAKAKLDKVSAEAKKGYERVRAKIDEVDVKEVRDDVVDYIRQNPGKAVLIALGVGFALGFLVRRREP